MEYVPPNNGLQSDAPQAARARSRTLERYKVHESTPSPRPDNRPQSVRRAVICLWIAAGLYIVDSVVMLVNLGFILGSVDGKVTFVSILVMRLLFICLFVLVAVKFGAGRSWARWLFAVPYASGLLLLFFIPLNRISQVFLSLFTVANLPGTLVFVAQTAALIFMFASASSQWLKIGHSKE